MNLKTKIVIPVICSSVIFVSGCTPTVPKGSLVLKPESLELRQVQSKLYEDLNEEVVISSAVSVMQDLGYTIKETESKLGLVVGEKKRDATEAGQVALAILGAFLGARTEIDSNQAIKMSLVVSPISLNNKTSFQARIAIQRVVWNTAGRISKIETLSDAEIYNEFFTKLDKALFLEKNT